VRTPSLLKKTGVGNWGKKKRSSRQRHVGPGGAFGRDLSGGGGKFCFLPRKWGIFMFPEPPSNSTPIYVIRNFSERRKSRPLRIEWVSPKMLHWPAFHVTKGPTEGGPVRLYGKSNILLANAEVTLHARGSWNHGWD